MSARTDLLILFGNDDVLLQANAYLGLSKRFRSPTHEHSLKSEATPLPSARRVSQVSSRLYPQGAAPGSQSIHRRCSTAAFGESGGLACSAKKRHKSSASMLSTPSSHRRGADICMSLDEAINSCKMDVVEENAELESAETKALREELESQKEAATQAYEQLQSQIATKQAELQAAQSQISAMEVQLVDAQQAIQSKNSHIVQLSVAEAEMQMTVTRLEQELTQSRHECSQVELSLSLMTDQANQLVDVVAHTTGAVHGLQRKCAALTEQLQSSKQQLASTQSAMTALQQELSLLQVAQSSLQQAFSDAQIRFAEQKAELQQQITALQSVPLCLLCSAYVPSI